MSVNKFTILKNELNKYVNIPVEMTWDFTGRDEAISDYENEMIKEVVGIAKDFEIIRFYHSPIKGGDTDINYEFNFYDFAQPISSQNANITNWGPTYLNAGFTVSELYYYTNPFTKSFFKLDFYDTTDEKTQKNYFTIILPVQQGLSQTAQLNPFSPLIDIRIPYFKLDFLGDKEGFFIYWLRERDYIDIDTFYMSAKFFDARIGSFVRMTNRAQVLLLPDRFTFNNADYFYYRVKLDYPTFTYKVNDILNLIRVGTASQPIKWYEYVNP